MSSKQNQAVFTTNIQRFFWLFMEGNERKEHQFNITEITYASPQNVTPLYQEQIIVNPSLGKVIEKQLIFGPTYSYTYTNTMEKRRKTAFTIKVPLIWREISQG
jgi:hypothetical protein